MDRILIENQIRKFRRENGLTHAQLTERVHMSEKMLSDIENGKINPRYKSVISMSRALGVSNGILTTETKKLQQRRIYRLPF